MSVRVSAAVWEHGPTEGYLRLLLLAIADRAHDNGEGAWPSLRDLGRMACVDPRTAERTVKRLEKEGWITVDRRPGRANRYRIDLDRLRNGTGPRTPTSGVGASDPGRPRPLTPDAHVRGPRTPTSPEPSRTVIEPPRSGVSPPPSGRRPTLTPWPTPQPPPVTDRDRGRPPPEVAHRGASAARLAVLAGTAARRTADQTPTTATSADNSRLDEESA